MATFTFDGSTSRTTAFNATVDRVVFDLDAADLASISEDRANNVVTIVATSGAVLTLTGTNLAALDADNLVPGFESDIVFGIGTDTVDALGGNVLVGLAGGDTLDSTAAGAIDGALIFGNAGADIIDATGASVRIYGGLDGDSVTYENGDADSDSLIVGGLGVDRIQVGNPTPGGGAYAGDITIFGGSEAGDPTDGGDTIGVGLSNGGSALVYGNGGDDSITVFAASVDASTFDVFGATTVFGGQGNDTIFAVAETAVVYGGAGTDTIQASSFGESGSLTVYGGNGAGDAGDGADTILVTAFDGATAFVYGNAGDDVIQILAPGAIVSVFGGQGNDFIGADSVIGGLVGDGSQIHGGLGIDIIDIAAGSATIDGGPPRIAPGDESITVYGGNGDADAADSADVITVELATTPVAPPAAGITLPDLVQTAVVYGNGGDDVITLLGRGAATVFGGAGDDSIAVENGRYVLTGGVGEDVFDFSSASETSDETLSSITDFDFSADGIVFAGDVDSTTVGQATIATADDVGAIAAANTSETQVAVITVSSGDLAGDYAVFDGQVIEITGFTGTIDAGAFTGLQP